MNVFAKFDEIPLMTLQDIKETKRHGHTFVRLFGQFAGGGGIIILSQVVPQKSLTKKKSLQTNKHSDRKGKNIYPLYTLYAVGIIKLKK